MKNFYVILIVVSVVAGLALGYGIWGKDKANFEKLQKVMEEKEVNHSRTLAESEELRNISEELRGKISGLETDNDEFKDILKKIDELIGSKVERTTASVVPEPEAAPVAELAPVEAVPADAVPANAASSDDVSANAVPAVEEVAPVANPEPEASVESVEPALVAAEPTAKIETVPAVSDSDAAIDAAIAEAASLDAAIADAAAELKSEPEFTMPPAPVELAPAEVEGAVETEITSEVEVEKTDTDTTPLTPVPELKSEHLPVKDVI